LRDHDTKITSLDISYFYYKILLLPNMLQSAKENLVIKAANEIKLPFLVSYYFLF